MSLSTVFNIKKTIFDDQNIEKLISWKYQKIRFLPIFFQQFWLKIAKE